ncbi:RagB/SusD family nutrient uptake outer membrane protein [Sphingobacterium haloxyli]|nr:RagB/SusD family nutrient uptake outer membrane protein [Sphingobacterium haloxyli]
MIVAITIATIMVFMAGCDSFLDLKSSNNYATVSTIEDVEAILNNTQIMNFRSPCLGEASADDIYIPDQVYDRITKNSSRDTYIWKETDYGQASSPWGTTYETVFYANVCLEALEKMSAEEKQEVRWARARAAALVFRSNAFLQGIWIWGKAYDESTAGNDLGMVIKTNPDVNEPSVRKSVKDTYQQIIGDLNDAIKYLPNIAEVPVTPSKAAAYGLLARTYLSMRQYETAGLYADSCLQLNNELMNFNTDINIPAPTSSVNPFNIFNKEVIFSTVIGSFYFAVSPTYAVIDTMLIYSYDDTDLRRRVFFRNTANGAAMRGNYSQSSSQYFTGISTAEMMLVRAECMVRENFVREGLELIDWLRTHRYSNGIRPALNMEMTQQEALDMVLVERRKELVMRSLRWMDVKRLNKEGRNILLKRYVNGEEYLLLPNESKYARPLPTDVIALSGMLQN